MGRPSGTHRPGRWLPGMGAAAWLLAVAAALAGLPPAAAAGPPFLDAPVLLPTFPAAAASREGALEDRIAACVEEAMARHDTPGASVAVLLDGAPVLERGFGVRRRGGDDPVGPDTAFRIGSLTKQMTAAVVMRLAGSGSLDLQAPITRVLPELEFARPGQAAAVTPLHLLTHTSGVPDSYRVTTLPPSLDLEGWLPAMHGLEPYAPPGAFWNYSNPNYSLAGLLAERAAGVPFESLAGALWADAGMTRTTLDPAVALSWGDVTWGHDRSPFTGQETILPLDDLDSPVIAPAGGAIAAAPDLVRWALLLMERDPALLRPAAARELQAPHVPTLYSPDLWYGYGVFVQRIGGVRIRWHTGSVRGWGAFLAWSASRRFAVAVLANTTQPLSDAGWCIVDAVLAPGDVPPPPVPDPAAMRRYEGLYRTVQVDGRRYDARVRLERDGLWIVFTDPEDPSFRYTTRLEPYGYDTFLMDGDGDGEPDLDLTFVTPGGGPGSVRWFRSRHLVGTRAGAGREAAPHRPPGGAASAGGGR